MNNEKIKTANFTFFSLNVVYRRSQLGCSPLVIFICEVGKPFTTEPVGFWSFTRSALRGGVRVSCSTRNPVHLPFYATKNCGT